MLKFDSRFNVLYFTYFKPIYRSTLIRRASISESRNRMVRGGGKEGRRKRHANVVRLPPFPLVEVVRPTIAARMWSIVSSHRTTCMTHFRVHVYRLTWNIYSNRLTEHNPIRPSVSLSLTSRRIVLDIHPFLLLLSHLHLSSLYPSLFSIPFAIFDRCTIVTASSTASLQKFSPPRSSIRSLVIFPSNQPVSPSSFSLVERFSW